MGCTAGKPSSKQDSLIDDAASGDLHAVNDAISRMHKSGNMSAPVGSPERTAAEREMTSCLSKALLGAAGSGRSSASVTKSLLDAGADVEAIDTAGYTALLCAVQQGDEKIAAELLKKGADIDARRNTSDKYGETPLMLTIEHGDKNMVNFLCDAGAHLDKLGPKGTVLNYAFARDEEMLLLLLQRGATALSPEQTIVYRNWGNDASVQPIHEAAELGYDHACAMLIKSGDDMGAADHAVAVLTNQNKAQFSRQAREEKYGSFQQVPSNPSAVEYKQEDLDKHQKKQDDLERKLKASGFHSVAKERDDNANLTELPAQPTKAPSLQRTCNPCLSALQL